MKKTSLLLCVLFLFTALFGCGGGTGSSANYVEVLRAARNDELNGIFPIVADDDTLAGAGITKDDSYATVHDNIFHVTTGLAAEDMQRYAITLGFSITQAYGIAIVLPESGKEQAVLDQLNYYVESRKSAMEGYLADQYDIASNAIIRTAKTGEIILVMCEDAETVYAAIESGLNEK